MSSVQQQLRSLPSITVLLEHPLVAAFAEQYGHQWAKQLAQQAVTTARKQIQKGWDGDTAELIERSITQLCTAAKQEVLQRVINATGIVLHTNFGRAPWDEELLERVSKSLGGYCNLEYSLPAGTRGGRGKGPRGALARILNTEATLIVNNNAAAVLLILFEFAKGHEVIISRGELVQIGGGFRIPDILQQSGATVVEVGTSNITTLDDYRNAITDKTSMILKVHQSNFYQMGFAEQPSVNDLATLKSNRVMLVHDIGSGNLFTEPLPFLQGEPFASESLKDGADLICFSGDKLVGACQAGIIAGADTYIQRLEQHPLMRAIRPDKFAFAMLQETLRSYETGDINTLPHLKRALQSQDYLRQRITVFISRNNLMFSESDIIATEGAMGGGSLPGRTIASLGLVVDTAQPNTAARWFEHRETPVIGIVQNDRFILDFLTITPEEEHIVAQAIQDWQENKSNCSRP